MCAPFEYVVWCVSHNWSVPNGCAFKQCAPGQAQAAVVRSMIYIPFTHTQTHIHTRTYSVYNAFGAHCGPHKTAHGRLNKSVRNNRTDTHKFCICNWSRLSIDTLDDARAPLTVFLCCSVCMCVCCVVSVPCMLERTYVCVLVYFIISFARHNSPRSPVGFVDASSLCGADVDK